MKQADFQALVVRLQQANLMFVVDVLEGASHQESVWQNIDRRIMKKMRNSFSLEFPQHPAPPTDNHAVAPSPHNTLWEILDATKGNNKGMVNLTPVAPLAANWKFSHLLSYTVMHPEEPSGPRILVIGE